MAKSTTQDCSAIVYPGWGFDGCWHGAAVWQNAPPVPRSGGGRWTGRRRIENGWFGLDLAVGFVLRCLRHRSVIGRIPIDLACLKSGMLDLDPRASITHVSRTARIH
jgi:hypothetical protein